MKRWLPCTLALAVTVAFAAPATLGPDEAAFVKWAQGAQAPLATVTPGATWEDLRALGRMVGDARIVALSEGVHAGAEPLDFRNRVLQYLVREKGFTAIAIESGIVEGRGLHEYVLGPGGDPGPALSQGLSWTFDKLPQNESLIRWLQEYNADPAHRRKVNFYGFDIPGSPGNPQANRGTGTALMETLGYLDRVDGEAAAPFHKRLDSLLPDTKFDSQSAESPGYPKLTQAQRDTITASIADMATLLERREAAYVAASSQADYEWAIRGAIGARQVDQWLRQIPIDWKAGSELGAFFYTATDIRDRAQADNLDWVMKQEGPSGKLLVFASRYHLSAAPLKASFKPGQDGPWQHVAATYLRQRYGAQLVTIGNLIREGSIGCAGFKMELERAGLGSIDGLAGEVGNPLFLLDIRHAPKGIADWLNQEQQLGEGQVLKMQLAKAYDVLLYLERVSPACPK